MSRISRFILANKLYCIYLPLFWGAFILIVLLLAKGRDFLPFLYKLG
jgi:hypothetical protein